MNWLMPPGDTDRRAVDDRAVRAGFGYEGADGDGWRNARTYGEERVRPRSTERTASARAR
ncbi:hypothetical protein [Streptomyces violaceusniger]|uniref:hypothetical protein n=1 Tax=Streptomyces violaceusniger TaxID=68280 RepID=UPI00142F3B26|nr:hypothetical protein [Streptomyces violaceusniger]